MQIGQLGHPSYPIQACARQDSKRFGGPSQNINDVGGLGLRSLELFGFLWSVLSRLDESRGGSGRGVTAQGQHKPTLSETQGSDMHGGGLHLCLRRRRKVAEICDVNVVATESKAMP